MYINQIIDTINSQKLKSIFFIHSEIYTSSNYIFNFTHFLILKMSTNYNNNYITENATNKFYKKHIF